MFFLYLLDEMSLGRREAFEVFRSEYGHNDAIEENKGGYQKQQDATTCFVIDEAINQCIEERDKVYAAYVDISKAFDTMWINGLLYKLHFDKSLCGKVWKLVRSWYLDMQEFARNRCTGIWRELLGTKCKY